MTEGDDDDDGKEGAGPGLAAAIAAADAGGPQRELDLAAGDDGEAGLDPRSGVPEPGTGRRGAGRPRGSINKATAEWRDYLLERHGSPLIAAAELLELGPKGLARHMGISGDKALGAWVSLWNAYAPYVHQRLPTAVQLSGEGVVQLILGGAPAAAAAGDDAMVIEGYDVTAESVENQRLGDGAPGESDSGESDSD